MATRPLSSDESFNFLCYMSYLLDFKNPNSHRKWFNSVYDIREAINPHIIDSSSQDLAVIEEKVTPCLKDDKSFDDLIKAFRNRERQKKNRIKSGSTKKIEIRRKTERKLFYVFEDNGKSKLDTMDDIAEFLEVVCDDEFTAQDLKFRAHEIKKLVNPK